jgi:hypothetical protein
MQEEGESSRGTTTYGGRLESSMSISFSFFNSFLRLSIGCIYAEEGTRTKQQQIIFIREKKKKGFEI